MPDLICRFADFLASDMPGWKSPSPYWMAWMLIAGLNLFLNIAIWALLWNMGMKEDVGKWAPTLRKINAWGIITWPLSGFVLVPVLLVAGVFLMTHVHWLLIREVCRGTYRIACEVVSTAAGERK